jgi:hypothetical protein
VSKGCCAIPSKRRTWSGSVGDRSLELDNALIPAFELRHNSGARQLTTLAATGVPQDGLPEGVRFSSSPKDPGYFRTLRAAQVSLFVTHLRENQPASRWLETLQVADPGLKYIVVLSCPVLSCPVLPTTNASSKHVNQSLRNCHEIARLIAQSRVSI